jgi:hypothetical protein
LPGSEPAVAHGSPRSDGFPGSSAAMHTRPSPTDPQVASPRVFVSLLPSSQRSLAIVTGSAWCKSRYSSTSSASVIVVRPRLGPIRSSTLRSAFCASAWLANPPTCGRADPRPSSRYRYAQIDCPSAPFAFSLKHLTLLDHRRASSIDDGIEESQITSLIERWPPEVRRSLPAETFRR